MVSRFFTPHYGSDQVCELCDQPIERYRVEYQVTDPRNGHPLAFHMGCYKLWQLECCGVGWVASPPPRDS